MKTLIKIPLLFIFIIFQFHSCSKKVNIEGNDMSGKLEGNWHVEIYEYEGSTTSILQNDIWRTQFNGFGWNMDITMIFSEKPNNYSLIGDYFVDHFFTNRDGIETMHFAVLETSQLGTWTRNGNIVELIIDGENKRSFISELTDISLTLKINSNNTETESDGTITTTDITETYILERNNN